MKYPDTNQKLTYDYRKATYDYREPTYDHREAPYDHREPTDKNSHAGNKTMKASSTSLHIQTALYTEICKRYEGLSQFFHKNKFWNRAMTSK